MNTKKHFANFSILFFLTIALPSFSYSQVRDKKKTVDLLCHKWESNLTKNPQKMECFPQDAGSAISFLTNGYVIFTEKKGSEGVWNYDATRNNLYIIVNGTLWKYKINSLTATELAIEGTGSKANVIYYLQRNGE